MSSRVRFAWLMAGVLLAGAVPATTHAGSNAQAAAMVTVSNFIFNADGNTSTQFDTVKVMVGDVVTWQWVSGIHTVTNGTGPVDPNAGLIFDLSVNAGQPSASVTFNTAGDFPYFCAFHPSPMRGVVRVQSLVGVAPGALSGQARFAREPWPNPSASRVEMRVTLSTAGRLDLSVFDERGRRVADIFKGERGAGEWAFAWDGRDAKGRSAPSGFYILRLVSGSTQESRRIVLQR